MDEIRDVTLYRHDTEYGATAREALDAHDVPYDVGEPDTLVDAMGTARPGRTDVTLPPYLEVDTGDEGPATITGVENIRRIAPVLGESDYAQQQ